MVTIKLSDGTKLKNISINGDTFVSKSEIEDSVFEGKLNTVEITDSETKETTVLHDAELLLNKAFGDEWWFVIQEKTEQDKQFAKISNDITDIMVAIADVYEMIVQ